MTDANRAETPRETMLRKLRAGQAVPVFKQFDAAIEPAEDRRVKFTITTSHPDRERDVVDAAGIDTSAYERNSVVLFGHDYKSLPIGKTVAIERFADRIKAVVEFATADLNPMAEQVYRMVKAGFLKACSIGFRPVEWVYDEDRKGMNFAKAELLEWSVVPVPAHPMALVEMQAAGIDTAVVKSWAETLLARCEDFGPGPIEPVHGEEHVMRAAGDDPLRWNRQLSKAFDVDGEPLEPSRLEYKWVSRFLDTPVKDLFETTVHVHGARMGSFLAALDDTLAHYKTETVRNLTRQDREVPPVYNDIRLNSTLSRTFLIEGLRFLSGAARLVLKVEPSWSGLAVTGYIARSGSTHLTDLLAATGHRARSYKFLKGEAFSISGEFVERDGATLFGAVFLEERNIGPVQRIAKLLNEQGAAMECRGAVLMGPPGTGKTLAARALMNEAKDATYIWVSARDVWCGGTFGAITSAFDLARENAPSIVCFEDVDDAVADGGDLLKSEMDGVQTHKGVVTLLTTNFPERLPKALIDRPGRFHDVLQFDLPTEAVRRRMLDAWAPEASDATRALMARDATGFSGAHLRELVRYAGVLITQGEATDLNAALPAAFEKVKAQRALIDSLHQPAKFRAATALWKTFVARTNDGSVEPVHGVGAQVPTLYKAGTGTCDRCGQDAVTLCVGVCGPCANELHPWDGDALVGRVAQLSREQVVTLARADAPGGPFEADPVGWKAFARARDKAASKGPLSCAALGGLLDDYGFEAEAAIVRGTGYEDCTMGDCPMKAAGEKESCPMGDDCPMGMGAASDGKAARVVHLPVLRAGRVLSKQNETELRGARAQLAAAADAIDRVLDQAAPPEPAAEGEGDGDVVLVLDAEPVDDDDMVLMVAEADGQDRGAQTFAVDPEALREAIRSALGEMVARETSAAVDRARGRVPD